MYDIASALRRRAAAERLQGLQRAERAAHRAAEATAASDDDQTVGEAAALVEPRAASSPAATIADLLRGGRSPLFYERHR
jgi:hypothetical protein